MAVLRCLMLLAFVSTVQRCQAVSSFYLATYDANPLYIKGSNGAPATCTRGKKNALKFNILETGLTRVKGQTSFRSADFNRHYLVDIYGTIYLDTYDDTREFQRSASFIARKNYFYRGTTAYESINYPSYFLMCKGGSLVLAKPTSDQASRVSFTTPEATSEKDFWTECSRTCGGGTQKSLRRVCITPFNCEEPRSRPCNEHRCPHATDPCWPNPCKNGGRCFPHEGGYCTCPSRFSGRYCETETDPCSSRPCKNGGKCIRSGSSYTCRCTSGFTGDNCERESNPCDRRPCLNGGKCFRNGQSYICRCASGFTGNDCSIKDHPCKNSPCKNDGTCVPTGRTFTCHCAPGYTGKLCDEKVTKKCNPNPCQNQGRCKETSSGYVCKCALGYHGDRCQLKLRIGQWSPCSRTCGGGTRYRGDACQHGEVSKCPRTYQDCGTKTCPSVTCSGGSRHRYGSKSQCCAPKTSTSCSGPSNKRSGPRVIGGVVSRRAEWPWMAAIYHKSRRTFFCGGIIVDNRWVVTAGHCANEYTARNLLVLVGTNDLKKPENGHQWVDVEKIIMHPTYDNPIDDLGLLKLKSALTFTNNIKPLCFPNGERLEEDVVCFASGWGVAFVKDIDLRKPSDVLRHVGLRTLPHDACVQGYTGTEFKRGVTSKIICSGVLGGGKDTCIGDSGGPLVCQRKSSCEWYLAGITSFGPTECAVGNIPGGFMDIAQYETWIKEQINNN